MSRKRKRNRSLLLSPDEIARVERTLDKLADPTVPWELVAEAVREERLHNKWDEDGDLILYRNPKTNVTRTGAVMTQTTSPPPPDPQLLAQLRAQMVDVQLAPATSTKPLCYVLASNGTWLMKRSAIGVVTTRMEKGKVDIPGLAQMSEGFVSSVPPIPWEVFSPAIAFLRAVKERYQSEGLVRFYHGELGWTAHVPEQEVSAASVDVSHAEPDPQLGLFAFEIHSHPGSSSVFSGVDDAHEQMDRIFACVSFPDKDAPNFHCRIGTGLPFWFDTTIDAMVDMDHAVEFKMSAKDLIKSSWFYDPFKSSSYPPEWMEKVSKARVGGYTVHSTGQVTRGVQNQQGSFAHVGASSPAPVYPIGMHNQTNQTSGVIPYAQRHHSYNSNRGFNGHSTPATTEPDTSTSTSRGARLPGFTHLDTLDGD